MSRDPLPDTVAGHKQALPDRVLFQLLVISTTRHAEKTRGVPSSDKTVATVQEILENAGHVLSKHEFLPDDVSLVKEAVATVLGNPSIDILLCSGGTGISPKDKTIEVLGLLDTTLLPGFGELFRHLSYREIGSAAMLSRAEAFIKHQKAIFCLPGSPRAVKLALDEIILPEAGHLLSQLRKVE